MCLALSVLILATASVLNVSIVHGIDRHMQSVNAPVTFSWSSNIQLPKGQLFAALTFPLGISVSGLPNKVIPGEKFDVPISIAVGTGIKFAIGDQTVDLDSVLSSVLSYIPSEIDLRPYVALITCTIARHVLEPVEFIVACGTDGTGLKNGAIHEVMQSIELKLVNYLTVEIQSVGPAELRNSVLQTWFGKSGTANVAISGIAQRGQQLALNFASRWTMSLYFNFQQGVYDNPLLGWVFKKIRDLLHLPWKPLLGVAQGGSIPSLTSLVLIPDFQLSTSSQQPVTVALGRSSTVGVTVSAIDEFDQPVTLAAHAPPGIQASFQGAQTTPSLTTMLIITASDSASTGDSQLSITATGGGKTHDLSVPIHVTSGISTTGGTPPWVEAGPWNWLSLLIVLLATLGLSIVIAGVVVSRPRKRISLATPSPAFHNIRFCRHCGGGIRPSSRYCTSCGYNQKRN